ncbi:MAG: type transport system ATP-binding protein, partial [Mycobacterium sp.]|nr:type transport system ATP-binding protein [Mycobacterium sp.]
MGPGIYIGRIGGLAVALGIGAAIVMGQGVASAQPADTSGSESSPSKSGESSSGTESTKSADTSKDTSKDTPSKDAEPSTTEKTADATDATDATGAEAETDETADKDTPKRKKRSHTTESGNDAKHDTDSGDTTPRVRTVHSEAASVGKADDSSAANTAAKADAEDTKVTTADVVVKKVDSAAERESNDPVTVTISRFVSALVSPFAGDGGQPAAPVDTPAVWTLAAAARREFLGAAPSLEKDAEATTNSLVADKTAAEETDDEAEPVKSIPWTPLLTQFGLQNLPIIGPLAVTPIVSIISSIPLIGDVLHPFVGYPLGMTGGSTPRDVKVISFDGTPIYVHFFPAQGDGLGKPAPTILNGPGLGLPGETNPLAVENPLLTNQVIGMGTLLQHGYNVVTWDPRGEWGSGGTLEIDSPDYEAKDMQAIISWVAQQPEAAFDTGSTTDPQIGMVGASYGGGIQLVTAAIDCRVDAIAPMIAWHSLTTSL